MIKVEPKGGEHLRRRGVVGGAALPFAMLNANKRSVSLDLKNPKAARPADRDGQARRRAGGELRARRDGAARPRRRGDAQASTRGWSTRRAPATARTGPYRDYPGDGPHRAGDVRRHGHHRLSRREPPSRPARRCAISSPACISTAASSPRCSSASAPGAGAPSRSRCSTAVYASLSSTLGMSFGSRLAGARSAPATATAASPSRPTTSTRPATATSRIICVGEQHWKTLLDAMGRAGSRRRSALRKPEDARRTHGRGRRARRRPHERLQQAGSVRAADAASRALRAGAHLMEVVNDPHLHQRGMLQWIDHPELGRIVLQSSPMRYRRRSRTAASSRAGSSAPTTRRASAAGSACRRTKSARLARRA